MKRVISLKEASSLTPYEKMHLFDAGKRRENIKACATTKLLLYYKICLTDHLKTAQRKIESELLDRGLGSRVKPEINILDPSRFELSDANFILDHIDDPDEVIFHTAKLLRPGLTTSDIEFMYLILAMALDAKPVVNILKKAMKAYDTYYAYIPELITEIMGKPEILARISKIMQDLGIPV